MSTQNFGKLKKEIDSHSVISFDIFDTLICRSVASPRDVFRLVAPAVRKLTSGAIHDFATIRVAAERAALDLVVPLGIHEVVLDQIYEQIGVLTGVSPALLEDIKALELLQERKCLMVRPIGKYLFDYAVSIGKIVVLASDMYLPKSEILTLLSDAGYTRFDRFYLSSEILKTKRVGEMFDHMIEDLGVTAADIIHFGDNPVGDDASPKARGLATAPLPRAPLYASTANPAAREIHARLSADDDLGVSVMKSLIATRYFDEVRPQYGASVFRGNAYQFGYMALGTMMLSFCSWLHRQAKRDGTRRLFFLSRDGLVMKRVYDTLFSGIGDIETEYLFCSRRSTRIPLMTRPVDVFEPIKRPIFATEIGRWLTVNYGIDGYAVPDAAFQTIELAGPTARIGGKFDKTRLEYLVDQLQDEIADAAESERTDYSDYLKTFDFGRPGDAIVDIGYAGTMQNALSLLTGTVLPGYYFAVFGSSLKSGIPPRLIQGFVTQGGSDADPAYGICTHRFVYESIICSDEDTFVRMVRTERGLEPLRTISVDDDRRKQVVRDIHGGCVALAEDFRKYSPVAPDEIYASGATATAFMDSFLRKPLRDDVKVLAGVRFDDLYGPEMVRYLAPISAPGSTVNPTNIIWKEGLGHYALNDKAPLTGAVSAPAPQAAKPPVHTARPVPQAAPAPAAAAVPPAPPKPVKPVKLHFAQVVRAKALLGEAKTAFAEADYPAAAAKFEELLKITGDVRYARAAAEAHGLLTAFDKASDLLKSAEAETPQFSRLRRRREQAERKEAFTAADADAFSIPLLEFAAPAA